MPQDPYIEYRVSPIQTQIAADPDFRYADPRILTLIREFWSVAKIKGGPEAISTILWHILYWKFPKEGVLDPHFFFRDYTDWTLGRREGVYHSYVPPTFWGTGYFDTDVINFNVPEEQMPLSWREAIRISKQGWGPRWDCRKMRVDRQFGLFSYLCT